MPVDEARNQMAALRRNKKNQSIDVLSKNVFNQYSLAMVGYSQAPTAQEPAKDLTLFLVWDHRQNSNLEKIAKFLFQDLLAEEKNIFIEVV